MGTRLSNINAALAELREYPLEFESAAAAAAFGDQGVVDPEDDNQVITAAIYPQVRASLLNAYPWSWLTERQVLIAQPARGDENAEAWPYPNRYRLPNPSVGNLRAVYDKLVSDRPRPDGWRVQGGYLYASFEVGYIEDQRQVDETVFPQLFENALILTLASRFAMPLIQDIDTMRIYAQLAERALRDAKRVDAQGHPAAVLPRFEWEEARQGEVFGSRRA